MKIYNIHPDFKTKKILGFLADLIIDDSYNDYSDLTDADKARLSALLIETSYLTHDELNEIMESLFAYAIDDYQAENREWLEFTAKNGDPDEAYDRYRDTLS